jgi:hypothetical protein
MPLAAEAGTINVVIGVQNVIYLGSEAGNTGSIFDTPGGRGRAREVPTDLAKASQVATASFELDNILQGTLLNSNPPTLYGDLKVDGVGAQIPKGPPGVLNVGNNGGGFGYDFFTSDGYLIELGIDELSQLVISDGIFLFYGTATVNLASQNLPFNLEFTSQTVSFSYTATSVTVPSGGPGTNIDNALGRGAFTITGEGGRVIPEPAVTVLLGSALVTAALALHRRRRADS